MTVTIDQIYEVSPGARKMSRGYLLTFCPFHQDDSPSLLVFADGWFRCKGAECGRTGRLETLYDALVSPGAAVNGRTEHAKSSPPWLPKAGDTEAIERLAWDAHDVLLRNESFRWYLEMRGVGDRVEPCKLGWYDGWITIPIMNRYQQIQGLVLRATKLTQKMTGLRFVQPVGQQPQLYCPDWGLVDRGVVWRGPVRHGEAGRGEVGHGSLFVVFGMFDSLSLASLRIPSVTTTGGSQTFRTEWLDDMRRKIVVLPDETGDDEPARKLATRLGWRGSVMRLPYDETKKDPADYLQGGGGGRDELARIIAPYM